MNNYPNITSALTSVCWAILPEKMDIILRVFEDKVNGVDSNVEVEAKTASFSNVTGNIGVIPIFGTISQRPSAFPSGGVSTMEIGKMLDTALNDSTIGSIVLDIDSPGGSVAGITELAQKIFESRGQKPIIAMSNSLMASAAYWIGSAADEIVVSPSSMTGSIGVIAVHTEESAAEESAGIKTTIVKAGKFKAEANSSEPLTDEARAALQSRVDGFYSMFTKDIARNRGISLAKVESDFGQGRILSAKDAVSAGMADRIATQAQVFDDIRQKRSRRKRVAATLERLNLAAASS